MAKNAALIEIDEQIKELNKLGCNIAPIKQLLGNNNLAVENFLIKMYKATILKSTNSIKFTKSIKLINKNPNAQENFTYRNNTDISKIIKNKQSKKAAFLLNFINSFTKILEEKNLNMLFTTQTIDSGYRHNSKVGLESNIMLQKDILNSFHRSENKHFYFFKKIDKITPHNSKTREFIRSIEFHGDYNLHEHTIKVFENSLEHTINYLKMYNKNRIKHQEIGRCEVVIPNCYKEGIIKAFDLKEHYQSNKKTKKKELAFFYNDSFFKGTLKEGNLLCIKFFDKNEEVNKQIVKYLVSYLNKNEKDIYQHIFNNLNIRNFTHSNVLFSKSLFEKIYKNINRMKKLYAYTDLNQFIHKFNSFKKKNQYLKADSAIKQFINTSQEEQGIISVATQFQIFIDKVNKAEKLKPTPSIMKKNKPQYLSKFIKSYKGSINRDIDKYKDLYHFTKEYNANKIKISFEYENTIHNSKQLEELQDTNQAISRVLDNHPNNSNKHKEVMLNYNKFIKRHKQSLDKMQRVMDIEFIKQDITLKIDMNKYKAVSIQEYKKIQKVDSAIDMLNKAIRSEKYIVEQAKKQYAHEEDDSLDTFIYKDIMNEGFTYSKRKRIHDNLEIAKSVDNDIDIFESSNTGEEFDFYMKVSVDRLNHTLDYFKYVSKHKIHYAIDEINLSLGLFK